MPIDRLYLPVVFGIGKGRVADRAKTGHGGPSYIKDFLYGGLGIGERKEIAEGKRHQISSLISRFLISVASLSASTWSSANT